MQQKTALPVIGMHCTNCALTIEKTVNKIPGVKSAAVNYASEKLAVDFDDSQVNLDIINNAVKKSGYSLDISTENKAQPHDHMAMLAVEQNQKNKIFGMLGLAGVVFVIMIWKMLAMTNSSFPMFFIPEATVNQLFLLAATVSVIILGKPYFNGIVRFIKTRNADMDTLVGLGTFTAYLFSTFILLFPQLRQNLKLPEEYYFDVTIIVLAFISFGKYLESNSKKKTGEAIEKLLKLQPDTAFVEKNGVVTQVSIAELQLGDLIVLKPGSKVPVDGLVVSGLSAVDESMITGESMPVDKEAGSKVVAGTLNTNGILKFKAEKIGEQTLLANIIRLVSDAQGSKPAIQKLVDQIAAVFVPAVLIIATLSLIIWVLLGNPTFAILGFVSVLVIACPCALGLATPTAIIVGVGKAALNGILFKNAQSIQNLPKVTTVIFDKTGTITKGKPELTDIILAQNSQFKTENDALQILASLEENSEHPIAQAINRYARKEKVTNFQIENFKNIAGQGLTAEITNQKYWAGNMKLVSELNLSQSLAELFSANLIESLTNEGKTPIFLTSEKQVLAVFTVSDQIKPESVKAVADLHKLGLKLIMLSGDHLNTATTIANTVKIEKVIAEVLPQDKARIVKDLQEQGEIVAMVGDGVNDAPALAQANIGIAMSTGTDVAIETADVTILAGDLSKVALGIKQAKQTMTTIKQNLFWAFIFNIIGIPLAAGLLYPFIHTLLNPAFAGIAMSFSSVLVVSNSLRLKLLK